MAKLKQHRRMLILSVKMLAGHSMEFAEKFAEDFAQYRNGTANLHPSIVQAFQRFEKHFGIAFKHRKFINQNHELHTNVYGPDLLEVLRNIEKGLPAGYRERIQEPVRKVYYPVPRTLH